MGFVFDSYGFWSRVDQFKQHFPLLGFVMLRFMDFEFVETRVYIDFQKSPTISSSLMLTWRKQLSNSISIQCTTFTHPRLNFFFIFLMGYFSLE